MWDVENFLGRTVFGQNVRISMKIERPYCFRTLEKKLVQNNISEIDLQVFLNRSKYAFLINNFLHG